MVYPVSNELREIFSFLKVHSIHDTTHATKCRNEVKNHFKGVLDHLPKLPLSRYFE